MRPSFLFLYFTLFDEGAAKMDRPISIDIIWQELDPFLEIKKYPSMTSKMSNSAILCDIQNCDQNFLGKKYAIERESVNRS